MLQGYRSILFGSMSLALAAGCGSTSYESSRGSNVPAAAGSTSTTTRAAPPVGFTGSGTVSGTNDQVVATASAASVAVVTGARATISFTFASTDGHVMSGFGVSGTLATLPAGWSGPANFTCAAVSIGSGCVLNLVYAPVAVNSGMLTVNYVVIDNASTPSTTGSLTIPYAATASNNVAATVSPTGQIDAVMGAGSASVSVNFTTDDGQAATQFAITTDLTALPQGWSSAAPSVTCAIVGTGSGCRLALTYAATAAGGGTLSLSYSYVDDSGTAKAGTLNIPYFATSPNNVVATASPTGQIIAVQKTGGQAVPITFTTDDGKPATQLFVTSNLAALPPGWSSGSKSFSCGTVSTGNGCLLPLTYSPSVLASGTLTLNYAYTDDTGMPQTGSLNIDYAATTNDNVVGSASPGGQINAVVSSATQGIQPVTVAFTTDDARPATALQLTSDLASLPAGWTSTATAFTCAGIDKDNPCRLPLTYAPTVAGNGTLSLAYAYKNNAGESKVGTVTIAYRATTDDNLVETPSQSSLAVRTGSSTPLTVTFTADDGNPETALSVTAGLTALPAGWSSTANSFACAGIDGSTQCVLSLTYAPMMADAGTLTLAYGYVNNSGFPKTGTVSIAYAAVTPYLYVANTISSTLSACALNDDDSLPGCTTTGSAFNGPIGIALNGSYAYIADNLGNSITKCTLDAAGALSICATTGGLFSAPTSVVANSTGTLAYVDQGTGLTVCAIAAGDGSLSNCAAAGAAYEPLTGIVLSGDGSHAYAVHATTMVGTPPTQIGVIEVCTIAMNGTFSGCTPTATATPQAVTALAIHGGNLYVAASTGVLYVCPLNADATIGSCATTPVAANAGGLAFIDGTAYVSTGSALAACPLNADGSFGSCGMLADPTFNGTAGVIIR